MRITYYISSDNIGTIHTRIIDDIKQEIYGIKDINEGKRVRVSVEELGDKRSLDQNSYYWAVIVPHVRKVRADNGDPVSEDTVHEDLLFEFAPRVEGNCIKTNNGKRPMRSKEMKVKEFSDYVTTITAAMAAFGEPVPLDY